MKSERSLAEKVVAIHDSLSAERVPHAFGGALALAYYAEPRATIDIDVNVFCPPAEYPRIADALAPLGVDPAIDPLALEREGQVRIWWGRTPVDLFFAYGPLHEAMRAAARNVAFGEDELPILAPEHLAVCKAVFNRPKDWLDIEQMLVSVEHIDHEEILRWLSRLIADDDPRTQRFDRLAEEMLGHGRNREDTQ